MLQSATAGPIDAAAQAAIRDVIVGFCNHIDAYEDEQLVQLFSADGEWWRPGAQPLRGHAQLAGYLVERDRNAIGRHIASNIVVEMEGPAQARAVSYYTAFKSGPGGAPAPSSMGEHHDVFRLENGRWRIARRETRRVFRAD